MEIDEADYLAHYGILRRSGRYPWGSGDDPEARSRSFLGMVNDLRKQGLSDTEIARGFGMTTSQLRSTNTIARNVKKASDVAMVRRLSAKGMSNIAIGKRMGIPESTVRSLKAQADKVDKDILQSTAQMLRDQVAKKRYVDIGAHVEHHIIGVSETKLRAAVNILRDEGYEVRKVKIDQLGTGNKTEFRILAAPGTTQKEVWQNRFDIKQISDVYSNDGGLTHLNIKPPLSIDSKRLKVRYKEEGGSDADGVIYVRPGVEDLSLGGSRYAQVRIAIDGTHYIKGMAMYKNDLPPGVDLEFNTNKSNTGNKLDALKPMKRDKDGNIDPDNPFGSAISRQITKKDAEGKDRVTSAMNIVNEEGNWGEWSKSLSSQMLSKQSPTLAKRQLDLLYEQKRADLDEIMSLTNPSVKKKLLESYADDADGAAVHLKAAAMPRQATHVILPITSMKETEIYAPKYDDGERVVLIRYPHGGIFEIPELVVNNRHPEAKSLLGNAKDAVGIHPKVAERLSGADFDGDTVLVIPNNKRQIKTAPALADLKGFDPKAAYPKYEGMTVMDSRTTGMEMGKISNLITDMTIQGAPFSEIARAVKHSMVVIDAEKHELNWKQSAIDNGIASLKIKYQGRADAGARTLISRASSEKPVPERKQGYKIDPDTGKKIYTYTGATKVDAKGRVELKTQRSTKLAETDDAHTLSSGTVIEKVYADHSNRLKALANEARKALVNTPSAPYSPSARMAYAKEVESLTSKLVLAQRNAPLERQAQVIGNAVVSQKRRDNPDMDKAEVKKLKAMALAAARARTGAQRQQIHITDQEWAAIQAGAISTNRLNNILDRADLERVKELATPRAVTLMTPSKTARARAMLSSGHTQAEVARALGVSTTTLMKSLSGSEED